jgi:hypothetical protein
MEVLGNSDFNRKYKSSFLLGLKLPENQAVWRKNHITDMVKSKK